MTKRRAGRKPSKTKNKAAPAMRKAARDAAATAAPKVKATAPRKKVAVLGGGMAGLTTAWKLTDPTLSEAYDVTVYTLGWRLGGKGASGRNMKASVVKGRIEEHGLHFIFGFYENAWRIIIDCYEKLGLNWEHVFLANKKPMSLFEGREHFELPWPPVLGTPGDDKSLADHPVEALRGLTKYLFEKLAPEGWTPPTPQIEPLVDLPQSPEVVDLAVLAWQAHQALEPTKGIQTFSVNELITDFVSGRLLRILQLLPDSSIARWLRVLLQLMAVMGLGILLDVVARRRTWFDLDREDLRTWLRRHGASQDVLDSAFVRGLYAAIFSEYVTVGAGTIVHALMRASFAAKGAPFYRMARGMGDAIFLPLYEVLKQRGVKFKFFHKVKRLKRGGDRITEVHFEQQARLKASPNDIEPYDPFINVQGLKCWPTEPKWDLLEPLPEGTPNLEDWWEPATAVATPVLRAGADFEHLVLATSVGVLPWICDTLVDDPNNPAFGEMVRGVATTQTQAAQLWFNPKRPPNWPAPTVVPFDEPFDTVADMGHLRAEEKWDPVVVGGLAYLCSPFKETELPPNADSGYTARQKNEVRQNLERWLKASATTVWPNTATNGAFDPAVLAGTLDQQYWCATVNPSDRYVLAVAGTNRYRLDANQSGYENLVLAGDWTLNALSVGCLESAVMGGIRAAQAIEPKVPKAEGDWLPAPASATAASSARLALKAAAGDSQPRPTFTLRDGDLLAVPPIDLDVELSLFLLRSDGEALQDLCDAHLNLGKRHYRPLAPYVVFYTSTMDNIVQGLGTCPEIDCGFWVPLLAGELTHNGFEADRLVTYTPYLWVDNDVALIGGREVFGFPKHLANFTSKGTYQQPGRWTIDAHAVTRFDTRTRVQPQRIVTLEGVSGSSVPPVADAASAVLGALERLAQTRIPARVLKNAKRDGGMGVVFLKQAPHSTVRYAATHRALVEGTIRLTALPQMGPINATQPFTLEIRRYATHDIVRRLGLRAQLIAPNVHRVNALEQWWMKFSATVSAADSEREGAF